MTEKSIDLKKKPKKTVIILEIYNDSSCCILHGSDKIQS